jgi:hypothetical protein
MALYGQVAVYGQIHVMKFCKAAPEVAFSEAVVN